MMRTSNQTITAATFTATKNFRAWTLDNLEGYSIVAKITGSPNGSIKLQASNDAFTNNTDNNESSTATWVDISGTSQTVSTTGNYLWNVSDAYYRAVRVVWTHSSGSATIELQFHAKGPQS